MSHQVHWVKGFGRTREAVLDAFAAQVERLGHVDNWFEWELWYSLDRGVEVRVPEGVELPRVRALWAGEQPWKRAAWAEVHWQFGLGGPRAVALAPVLPNEPEDLSAFSMELPSRPLLTAFAEAIAKPAPHPHLAFLYENVQARRREALAWLSKHELSTAPFLRDVAPDDWPAHLVGEPADGPVHFLAIDMHH